MNCPKPLIVVASVLSCALLASSAQAQLSYNVSAGSNPNGVFTLLGGSPILWDSGDISLPAGTKIGATPLEIDLTLSQNVTLDNAPSGMENLSFGLWFGFNNPLPAGTDPGTVKIELLENGVVLDTTPTSSPFGFGLLPFTSDEAGYGTGFPFPLPNNLTFNGVDAFITDTAPGGVGVTDFIVALPTVQAQGIPDLSNTLSLLFLGLVSMLGFNYRKVNVLR